MFNRRRDKRAQYRVPAGATIAIGAEVCLPSGKSIAAEVVDTSSRGARLRFTGKQSSLDVGRAVEIRFRQPGISKHVAASALVHNIEAEDGAPTIGFKFEDVESFYRQITPKLWELFNRRVAARVRPAEPIETTVECGEYSWTFQLFDIAAMGLGLEVPPEYSTRMTDFETLRATVPLPGGRSAVIEGDIVHRTPFGLTDRHGVAFAADRTPSFMEQQEAVLEYVLERESQLKA